MPGRIIAKSWQNRTIEVISFLALVYAVLGYYNQTNFHWVDSFWLSSYSERVAIVIFGIWRVTQEKNSYTRRRIAFLTLAIATVWLLIPYFLKSNFFNHHDIGSFWFFAYLAIIFSFGRRGDCSWNCPCAGIRETVGNPFRRKTLKGSWLWTLRHVKWVFLASLLLYLFLLFVFPFSFTTRKYINLFWSIVLGSYFASFLVIPWTGNRNYCRYLCPWGSLYGIIGKLGFFKIAAEREKCNSCGICEASCDMGIPILSLLQKHGEINVPDCIGCGRCITQCPKKVLRFVDLRHYLRKWGSILFHPSASGETLRSSPEAKAAPKT